MRAVIYGSRKIQSLTALALGLVSLGWSTEWREDRDAFQANQESLHEFDLIVTDGIRGPMGVMCREAQALQVPVLIADAAFIRRDLHYFQIGLNRLNWIPDYLVPGDRWAALDVELLEPRKGGEYILITGQKPGDAAHDLSVANMKHLYENWAQEIRRRSRLPVRFRPHPMGLEVKPDGVETIPGIPLEVEIQAAHAVVTWNSTSSVDAIIAGRPAFVMGPNAVAEEICNTDLQFIDEPYFPSEFIRRDFFHRVAYGQWRLEEFRDGSGLEIVMRAIPSQGPGRDLSS